MQSRASGFLLWGALIVAAGALGGCETTGGGPAAKAAAPPMTHQDAALACWMATEKVATTMTLDKRADIVTQCIKDKMDGKQQTALNADSKGGKSATKPAAKPKPKSAAKPATKPATETPAADSSNGKP